MTGNVGAEIMKTIADIYNADPEREWDRLIKSRYNQLELAVFMHHIEPHLPANGFVLDAGGGPGRYAIELCKRGFDVVLLDLSSGNIDLAKTKIAGIDLESQQRLKEFMVGDVADLSRFADATFDAVLCLDPLSCIANSAVRAKAVSELTRVAKPGSVVALGVRGYLDVLRTIARLGGEELIDGTMEVLKKTGNCKCAGVMHHFFRAQEIRELGEQVGLETMLLAGGEGLSSGIPEATEALWENPAKWERWRELVLETSTDPAVVEVSGHMLYLGRKK